MKTLQRLPGKQAGLSLIELMIASVIGLIILGGAVTILTSNSASSSMSSGMARLQDSGRVALDILSNSVRMAGFEGCRTASKPSPTVIAAQEPNINLPATALWGSEFGNGFAPPRPATLANLDGNVKPNTDVIYPQFASGRAAALSTAMSSPSDGSITLASNPDQVIPGDLMIISDCNNATIFRASAVNDNAGATQIAYGAGVNSSATLSATFGEAGLLNDVPTRIMRFEASAFFVGPSPRSTPGGDTIFSLYALDTSTALIGNPTELIEGVENIQILYGEVVGDELADGGSIRYVTANNVTDFANGVAVQIGILIATADFSASDNDTRTYNVAGTTIGPPGDINADFTHEGDKRLRAAFNTTIQLRNKAPL